MVANDEEQIAYARSLEVAALQYPGAECRITDDHVARVHSLHDHKATVAVVRDQCDRRDADLGDLVERRAHTIGLVAVGLEKALHVEQRESLGAYLRLIARGKHRL